ncbi:MAG: aromatic amino acid ammonia-lyase [Pseudomonadota bacterium]
MSSDQSITFGNDILELSQLSHWIYSSDFKTQVLFSQEDRLQKSHEQLNQALENQSTIYGVTTGFGDSSRRIVSKENSAALQNNLIQYLCCGVGPTLPEPVCRGVVAMRLQSLARGYSSVSMDLLNRMKWMIEEDVIPQIPSQGSLGASGDLVPLAYLARAIQGQGTVWHKGQTQEMAAVLEKYDLPPHQLKPKEGLALVNGTTVMAAYGYHNLKIMKFFIELAAETTALCCLALQGRRDAFGPLINSTAKQFSGQKLAAEKIDEILGQEDYTSPSVPKASSHEERRYPVQDKYSLRCAPQILGPLFETLKTCEQWVQLEASGVSDNPLIDEANEFHMGGNFYGGYVSHGMDYMKLSLGHLADMIDRQFMCLIDENVNRGLTPNLSNWDQIPNEERFIHHGLKGLNQAMSAITSELMPMAMPGGLHSRSSEAHNQDKVSLGLSACVQAEAMFDRLFSIFSIHLVGLCQAIDLRQIQLKSPVLTKLYKATRNCSQPVCRDRALDQDLNRLKLELKKMSGAYFDSAL